MPIDTSAAADRGIYFGEHPFYRYRLTSGRLYRWVWNDKRWGGWEHVSEHKERLFRLARFPEVDL